MKTRTISVSPLARIEGEAGLRLRVRNNTVTGVQLNVFEPPRFFEAFLRGRRFDEVPDIVARICGICPIAHQLTAIHALERACAVQVDPAIVALRRLIYLGEWIESHALHIYLLHAPDFLGVQDAIQLAGSHLKTAQVFSGILVIGVIGLVTDAFIRGLNQALFRWRETGEPS